MLGGGGDRAITFWYLVLYPSLDWQANIQTAVFDMADNIRWLVKIFFYIQFVHIHNDQSHF